MDIVQYGFGQLSYTLLSRSRYAGGAPPAPLPDNRVRDDLLAMIASWLLVSSRCVATRGSRLASCLRGHRRRRPASVHAGRQGKGRHTLLSTPNLYRTRGFHEASGRAA